MDKQKYSSAETSINKNKVPALYKIVEKYISKNSTILDYGAGKYNTGIEYYKEKNITVLPYDKYNRSKESNLKTFERVAQMGGVNTCLCANVLNVIAENDVIIDILEDIYNNLNVHGTLFLSVYEGDRSGKGKLTCKGYQRNAKTQDYIAFLKMVFPLVERRGKLLIARKTKLGLFESLNF